MSEGAQRMSLRIYQYRVNRRKFAIKVYGIAAVLVLLTALQWLPPFFVEAFRKFFVDYFYVAMIFLMLALVTVTVFVFVENVRFMSPGNAILAILIVEFLTYGLVRILANGSILLFVVCLFVTLAIVAIFIIIGVCMSHDLTLDVVIIFLCSVIFFIGSVFFVMLHIVVNLKYTIYIYCTFVIAAVLAFVMYHAQTINGSRYAEMRLNDYWLAALIIYHDYIILFVIFYYLLFTVLGDKLGVEDKDGTNGTSRHGPPGPSGQKRSMMGMQKGRMNNAAGFKILQGG